VECIWSNPICAGNKVKNNMEVMARQIFKYFDGANDTAREVQGIFTDFSE
jgi:hypothetical protein